MKNLIKRLLGIHVHNWKKEYFEHPQTEWPCRTKRHYGHRCQDPKCDRKEVYISTGPPYVGDYKWVEWNDFIKRYRPFFEVVKSTAEFVAVGMGEEV